MNGRSPIAPSLRVVGNSKDKDLRSPTIEERLQATMIERNDALELAAKLASDLKTAKTERQARTVKASDAVQQVFDHWRERTGQTGATLLDHRVRLISRHINLFEGKGGLTGLENCLLAIDGLAMSDWHMGHNPRSGGKSYKTLRHALNSEETERFIGQAMYRRKGFAVREQFDAWMDGLSWSHAEELVSLRVEVAQLEAFKVNVMRFLPAEAMVEVARRVRRATATEQAA